MPAIVRHILVKTSEQAEQLKVQINNGSDFAVLAKKYSTCASAKKGGELGEIKKGQLVKSIDYVVFNKPERIIHGPIKSQFGFHLIEIKFRY